MYFAKAFIRTSVKKALLAKEIEKEEQKLFEATVRKPENLSRSNWEGLIHSVYADLFKGIGVGIDSLSVHSAEGQTFMSFTLKNGDEIDVHTFQSPRKATVYINDEEVEEMFGSSKLSSLPRQVIRLYSSYAS